MDVDFKNHIEFELNNQGGFIWKSIGGGSINNTYKISSSKASFFVKTNIKSVFKNGFKEEVSGLDFLNKNSALTPKTIIEGSYNEYIFLVLEWINEGSKKFNFWKNFATQLVKLHKHQNDKFGLGYDNFMGELHQKNTFFDDFSTFFIENRLKAQIELAFNNGLLSSKNIINFENLYKELPSIFPLEKPCSVHGDLWSGNFICNENEKAVFIDPAVYYGYREIDLSMTKLFGGFSTDFYKIYQELFPLESGFENRKDIYNLYPLLIHLNLFGSSYYSSIETIVSKF